VTPRSGFRYDGPEGFVWTVVLILALAWLLVKFFPQVTP
jgi:hypothetical protein